MARRNSPTDLNPDLNSIMSSRKSPRARLQPVAMQTFKARNEVSSKVELLEESIVERKIQQLQLRIAEMESEYAEVTRTPEMT